MTTPPSTVELGSWGVEGAIRELAHAPTAAEFWKTAVHRWEPLLVRGAAASMGAFGAWTTEHLVDAFGNLTVRTERAKEDRRAGSQQGGMALSELLRRAEAGDDVYAISNVPHPMAADLQVPPFLLCGRPGAELDAGCADEGPWACAEDGCPEPQVSCALLAREDMCDLTFAEVWDNPPPGLHRERIFARCPKACRACRKLAAARAAAGADAHGGSAAAAAAPPPRWWTPIDEVGLWISAQSTRSQIHYDQTNIVNCLLRGEKEWVFIDTRKHWGRLPWECAAREFSARFSAQISRRAIRLSGATLSLSLAGTAT